MQTKDRFISLITVNDANMLPWFYKWIPTAVLAVSFTTTGVLYKKEQELLFKELQTEYTTGTSDIGKNLIQNMESYEQVMLGMKGLFEQEQPVTKEIFENYVTKLNLEKNFYGIQEIRFAPLVHVNEKGEYSQRIIHKKILNPGMLPEKKREYYLPALYTKWFGDWEHDMEAARGIDIALDRKNPHLRDSFVEIRTRAIEQARDTGKMIISSKTLESFGSAQDIRERNFHIYMPIYRYNAPLYNIADRQKQIIGYIDTSFSVDKFIEKIIPKNDKIDVEIYDGDQILMENQLYNSHDIDHHNPIFTSIEPIHIGGHSWKLQLKSLPNFEKQYWLNNISNIIQGGVLGGLLMAMFVSIAIRSRVKDLLTVEKEREMKEQAYLLNQELQDTLWNLSDYANALDTHTLISRNSLDGTMIEVNKKFCEVSQYSPEELIGNSNEMLKSGIHSQEIYQDMWGRITAGHDWRGELCNKAKDGSLFWVDTYIIPKKNSEGMVIGYMFIRIDITERKKAESKMKELASYDMLTGLPNRNLMMDRLNQAIIFSDRNSTQWAVLFIDLDRFKIVNDTFWHQIGDLLLQEVTQRMGVVVRSTDTVARHGGDEFVVILPEITNPENAQVVGQKLIDTLIEPFFINGNEIHIGASVGISIFPDDGNNSEVLLKNSDIAMYHAKESGRGKYQFFNGAMNKVVEERLIIGNALYQAIEKNEFTLHYQPVVDMHNNEVVWVEALIRWEHPVRGYISPEIFIPIAEENGLIVKIGEIALRLACKQTVIWEKLGRKVPRIAVNFSPVQFRKKTFLQDIQNIMLETWAKPTNITIEVTESIFIRNQKEVIILLGQLRDMGFKISMDDFGMWYSSLNTLKRFPIDTLKIDRTFVRDITIDPDDAAITRTIIAIAHSLKMEVIAEGVETKEQMDYLRHHRCNYYQGYYFSRPQEEVAIAMKIWGETSENTQLVDGKTLK